MLFFEMKGDETHKSEHLDMSMLPVGGKANNWNFLRGQEMSTSTLHLAQHCPLSSPLFLPL